MAERASASALIPTSVPSDVCAGAHADLRDPGECVETIHVLEHPAVLVREHALHDSSSAAPLVIALVGVAKDLLALRGRIEHWLREGSSCRAARRGKTYDTAELEQQIGQLIMNCDLVKRFIRPQQVRLQASRCSSGATASSRCGTLPIEVITPGVDVQGNHTGYMHLPTSLGQVWFRQLFSERPRTTTDREDDRYVMMEGAGATRRSTAPRTRERPSTD